MAILIKNQLKSEALLSNDNQVQPEQLEKR
jgi:hypothetical protein